MQREARFVSVAMLAAMFTPPVHAAAGAQESVTGLPLPDAASGMELVSAMDLGSTSVCRSTMHTSFYSVSGFRTSAAIAWYGAHLQGFRHLHGYGAGRTQDGFANANGSLFIGITGSPGKDGEDSEAFAILYASIKPGEPDKTLIGLLTQHVTC